jgi:membrane associated rhomboid family serine protease
LAGNFPATSALTFLCLFVFGAAIAVDGRFPIGLGSGFGAGFRLSTMYRFGVLAPWAVEFEPWRILSAVFLHFNVLHLVMNLFGLVGLGRTLEARFGSARSLLLFLVAGIGGFIVSVVWYGFESRVPTAGASGAIFGQLGALIGMLVARRLPAWKDLLLQNLVYAVVMGIALPVNNAAHLGGFAIGFVGGYLLEKERVYSLTTKVLAVLALLGALASVTSVVLSTQSPVWRILRERELELEA